MNRLIIIGNGFDLAHGLKTSYKDFIIDYLYNAMEVFIKERKFSDSLLEIKLEFQFIDHVIPNFNDRNEVLNNFYNIWNNEDDFQVLIKSSVLKNSLEKINSINWVDLEAEYFNALLEANSISDVSKKKLAIKNVNNQLDFLKKLLIDYLKTQQLQFSNMSDRQPIIDSFCDKIYKHELVTFNLEESIIPEKLYFLNFNYTNTFEDYYRYCKNIISSDFNYIHGGLGGAFGNPIFGFGDELDKRYLEFEDEKNNELFKHIKSFEYLKTKNYYLLTRFIEAENFQVHIYGHSCGISDRTMLNQIFEHENCKSIKIYYHKKEDGSNDYTDKIYEISRHFKDKGMMRKKIVPFDLSKEMPQPNKGIK